MRSLLRGLLWILVVGGLLVGAARAVALRWWQVPTDDPYLEASIAPTLRAGDWIILWRFSPARLGDLVMCPEPAAPDRVVIGRIAGVEGDSVEVNGSSLRINGKRVGTEGSCTRDSFSIDDPKTGERVTQRCDMEVLGSGRHLRGNVADAAAPATFKTRVEDGEVFLLSDNRAFPYDSREFGLVDATTCKETVVFRLIGVRGYGDVESRFVFIR